MSSEVTANITMSAKRKSSKPCRIQEDWCDEGQGSTEDEGTNMEKHPELVEFEFDVNMATEINTEEREEQEQCEERNLDWTLQEETEKPPYVEKPYKCEICGWEFKQEVNLKSHMRTHTGEKPYMCERCSKKFSRSQDLTNHLRTHTGEKPFKCEECGKGFAQRTAVKVHMRTHTGEKPYKCEVCGKGFAQHTAVKVHMRTHTGEKPYKCDECGRQFREKALLTCHRRTHTGEKPYICDACGKQFGDQNNLKRHKRTHSNTLESSSEKNYNSDITPSPSPLPSHA